MTDREVVPGCARVRTKCVGKTSVGLWGQSRSRQAYAGNRRVIGALQMVSEPTLAVIRACAGQCANMGEPCVRTGRTDVCQEGTFLWADEDVGSFEWVCVTSWLSRNERLLISTRCTFFSGSPDPKNSKVKRALLRAI